MVRYLLSRIGQTIVILFIVSIVVFFMMEAMPGDPVYARLGNDITEEEYEWAYHEYGYDQPAVVRYVQWFTGALHGDFGTSYQYKTPVMDVIANKVPVTLYLSIVSLLISVPVGIVLGVLVAVFRGKPVDTVITLICNTIAGIPQFWIALVLLYFLALKSGLLPSYGFTFPWVDFTKHIRQVIMPMTCLCLGGIAGVCRQTRSSILEVIRQDYVRTARAKGQNEKKVIFVHVLKNGLIPVVTMIGNRLAMMVGGSMFVEQVFSIPGMGGLMVTAITERDMPVVQACVLLTAVVGGIAYIITDLLYVVVDPRISLK